MTYGEIRDLINSTVIAFDSYSGKTLFDTLRSKKGKDKEFLNRKVSAMWVGNKKRATCCFPLTDTVETVLCLYLSREEGKDEL